MSDIVSYFTRDPFYDNVFGNDLSIFPRHRQDLTKLPNMNVDFMEKEKEYILNAELPGYKKEDLSVHVDDGILTLEAHKDENKEEKSQNYYHKERVWGKVQRSFRLPPNADRDKASVSYEDGVLKVLIPKSEVNSSKKKLTIS